MEGGKKTYFVSDVHLGLQVMEPQEREARFVSFLRRINNPQTEALYLLGDIWDFWYEWKYVVPKGYVQVLAALQDLVAAGVKVCFFQGNHDVWTYSYFEQMGFVKLTQPSFVEIDGKTFCLGHGDALGDTPFSYRLLRRCFFSRSLQWCFNLLHPTVAMSFGNAWSRNNRLARREQYIWKGSEEPLYKYCLAVLEDRKVDYFIFGHLHVSVRETLPGGATLIILDSWIYRDDYFCF